jgi:hypothetical protein
VGEIRQVNTRNGKRFAITIPAPKWFWEIPRDKRPDFASVKKYNGQWQLTVWGVSKWEVQDNFNRIAPDTTPQPPREDIRIEYPNRGQTYCNNEYGVYRYGIYPQSSVLAGQQMRTWLGRFSTLEEAQAKFPNAALSGCGFQQPYLGHLPEDGDPDPDLGAEYEGG